MRRNTGAFMATGGGCRFADRYFDISDNPWANTISTVTKDNLICEKFS